MRELRGIGVGAGVFRGVGGGGLVGRRGIGASPIAAGKPGHILTGIVIRGIVAGGGTAYVNAIPEIEKLIDEVEGDEKTGVQIIARALTAPLRQIATNAGLDASVILEKVKTSGQVGYGFDAYKENYCDMIGNGIVDPTKVTRSALENAASISAMLLTTEALVGDRLAPPSATGAGMPAGDMSGAMY